MRGSRVKAKAFVNKLVFQNPIDQVRILFEFDFRDSIVVSVVLTTALFGDRSVSRIRISYIDDISR